MIETEKHSLKVGVSQGKISSSAGYNESLNPNKNSTAEKKLSTPDLK